MMNFAKSGVSRRRPPLRVIIDVCPDCNRDHAYIMRDSIWASLRNSTSLGRRCRKCRAAQKLGNEPRVRRIPAWLNSA
jgi:hypothetical protein